MEFASNLRAAMLMQKVSSRELARRWHPDSPDGGRRSIMRYLAGTVSPTPEVRDQIAAALNVPPSTLPLPTDSSDDMLADLMAAVKRLEAQQDELMRRVA